MLKRIAFTGTSGSGKTTLVKWLKEEYMLPHLNASSGQLKTEEQNANLKAMGLQVYEGHQKIIQSGHANPAAAIANQWDILERRLELYNKQQEFVTDRCTIDNWVYYATQCAMYEGTEFSENFQKRCLYGLRFLTHIIYVPAQLFPIEDNGSRIANDYYQLAMDAIFDSTFHSFKNWAFQHAEKVKFLCITKVDLETRKDIIRNFLNHG